MPIWLDQARRHVEAGHFTRALQSLREGFWDYTADLATLQHAQALAALIAQKTTGGQHRRALKANATYQSRAESVERAESGSTYADRLNRIESNVTAFVFMKTDDENGSPGHIHVDKFAPIAKRIESWRVALEGCYASGYAPVDRFGSVAVSAVEQVRLTHLVRETVNTIVLDHVHVVEDIRELRNAVPACLGYAASIDDVRLRELLGALQRHSGTGLELPSALAMSTALLDAIEAARPPAGERDLFKLIAQAAFYVGVGAGLQDVIEASASPPVS